MVDTELTTRRDKQLWKVFSSVLPHRELIFEGDKGPMPKNDYMTMKMIGPTIFSVVIDQEMKDKIRHEIPQRYVLSFNLYHGDVQSDIELFQTKLQFTSFSDSLAEAGFVIYDMSSPRDLSDVFTNKPRPRYQFDLLVNTKVIVYENIESFDKIKMKLGLNSGS